MSTRWPSLFFISKGTKIPGPKVTCLKSHNQLTAELELVLRSFLGGGEVLPQVCYWHWHALLFTTNLIPDHSWETEARSPLVHDGNLPVWTGGSEGQTRSSWIIRGGDSLSSLDPCGSQQNQGLPCKLKMFENFPKVFFFSASRNGGLGTRKSKHAPSLSVTAKSVEVTSMYLWVHGIKKDPFEYQWKILILS